MSELKPCPFCGGKPKLQKDSYSDPDRSYIDNSYDYFIIKCRCGATKGEHAIKFFNEFSDYTVHDFRNNSALRAKTEDEYDVYLESIKLECIDDWNNRSIDSE